MKARLVLRCSLHAFMRGYDILTRDNVLATISFYRGNVILMSWPRDVKSYVEGTTSFFRGHEFNAYTRA